MKRTGRDTAFPWRWRPSESDNKNGGTHTAVQTISEEDETVAMTRKWHQGGEGPRNRAKVSEEISSDPRLE